MKAASLNHVYRLIWSKIQQAWVAVSETTSAQGKSSVSGSVNDANVSGSRFIRGMSFTTDTKWRFVIASAFAAAMLPQVTLAFDNPIQSVPVGDITVIKHSDVYTENVHHSTVNVVNYYELNVLAGQRLDVNMVNGGSSLYRVVGNNASQILGTLNSNGNLFLVNQNGILFGHGAEVNVGNIVASSMDISNDDFVKGNYRFVAGSILGTVENQGVIKSKNEGYIILLGNTVNNSGTLIANNGSVVLGAAREATLDFFGNGLVKVKLSGDALEATIKNSGLIQADGGFVQLASNARSSAINVSGIIEANQLVERDGVIRLEGGDNAKVQVSGQLIATGQNTNGGTIEVTGEQVALLNGSLLDASGDTGGGTVLVGGDYQGKNDGVYNSRTTYVAQGATIKADALKEGNGGKVVVWANDLTRYYGAISAKGGVLNGNGGFVEVSGKQNLDFHGKVNVAAVNGLGGTLLLDPANIVLTNSGSSITDNPNGFPDIINDPSASTTVNVADVSGFSELYLQATNDITVSSALTMTNVLDGGSIKFEAGNDINVNANLEAGILSGNITLDADRNINLAANLKSGYYGSVNLDAGNTINIGGNINAGVGGVTLKAVDIKHSQGNISTTDNVLAGFGGNVVINATGDVSLGNANINTAGTTTDSSFRIGGHVTINAKSLEMTGSINTSGAAPGSNIPNQENLAKIALGDAGDGAGGQGGDVTIVTANNVSVGDITTKSGDAGVGSTASVRSGHVSITSDNGTIKTGNIESSGGFNNIGGNVTLSALGSGGTIETGAINTSAGAGRENMDGKSAGSVNVQANSHITVGEIKASGSDGVAGSVAAKQLVNSNNKSGGAAGDVYLKAATGNLSVGPITNTAGVAAGEGQTGSTAKVFAQAGGNITLNGDITTSSGERDAVQLVAGGSFLNEADAAITMGKGGNWTIYSATPVDDKKGDKLLASYDYKQYATTFNDPSPAQNQEKNMEKVALLEASEQNHQLLGKGNGFIHAIDPTVTVTLTGTATKTVDGNANVIDPNSLVTVVTGLKGSDGKDVDTVVLNPAQFTSATYDSADVGTGKIITNTTQYTVVSATTSQNGKLIPIYNPKVNPNPPEGQTRFQPGYHIIESKSEATGSILAIPTTPTIQGFASPRDDAGLGGLIGNNPALNTMTIVSLNPAAGDEEDLDAVACPVNEDRMGSTPILNSGVKLPDGVSSNCI